MSEKLKPCPFCGGEATLRIKEVGSMWEANIICVNRFYATGCPAHMELFQLGYTKEETIDKITKRWNTRANPWHTGTPTEEGWYLVKENLKIKSYEEVYWNGKNWDYYGNTIDGESILKWQKIED